MSGGLLMFVTFGMTEFVMPYPLTCRIFWPFPNAQRFLATFKNFLYQLISQFVVNTPPRDIFLTVKIFLSVGDKWWSLKSRMNLATVALFTWWMQPENCFQAFSPASIFWSNCPSINMGEDRCAVTRYPMRPIRAIID
jgi:hypothetical protein